MARNFRRSRSAAAHPIADLNVTNLIDLGFMLLIIFMVAAPLMKEEQSINVDLPKESAAPQEKPDPDLRTESITIDARGNYYLNGAAISFPDLQTRIAAFGAEANPPVMRLRGDRNVILDKAIQVMVEIKKHPKLKKFDFATEVDK